VAIGAVCAAIGTVGHRGLDPFGALVSTLLGWLVWAGVTNLVGGTIFGRTATWGQVLRTLGFAKGPYVFLDFGIVPVFGYLVWVAVALCTLVAGIYAIHLVLNLSTHRAILLALAAFVIEYAVLRLVNLDGLVRALTAGG
jgi:hypothetical protein